MPTHPDQPAEQAFVDRAYERIAVMRSEAEELLEDAYRGRGNGTPQGLMERDVFVESLLRRLEQLSVGNESLCFGRIDFSADDSTQLSAADRGRLVDVENRVSEPFHIGRMALSDEKQEPLIVDWRAPIAEPFYRATGMHPMGLRRRRHFLTHGRKILDLEDEMFGDGEIADVGLSGGSVLLAALERGRSGRMRDIVATIQSEQDEIIRAPLSGVMIVQGGPGTGKTAVALHRAAYLLYTHRFPLETQGVLLVGPNPVFLRYIGHVLPSLGESGVEMYSIDGLVQLRDIKRGRAESRDLARLKGDVRMASVLRKAVSDRERGLRQDLVVPFGSAQLRLRSGTTDEIVRTAKRRSGTHNARRRVVETLLFHRLYEAQVAAFERSLRVGLRPSNDEEEAPKTLEFDDFAEQIRRLPEVLEALNRMWPYLTPTELLHDLFGAEPLVRLASKDLLTSEEYASLVRERSSSVLDVVWSLADLALLDEAYSLLGPIKPKKGDTDVVRTYGHIIVDEAQDLTPMQLRMLGRRSLGGSMTLVGDIAQATGPAAVGEWSEVLRHLKPASGQEPEARFCELTVSYRTPREILDVAGVVLRAGAPELTPPTSVRDSGEFPISEQVAADDLARRVVEFAVQGRQDVPEGNVAVIAPPSMVDGIKHAFVSSDVVSSDASNALDEPIVVLSSDVMKGLEFDVVILVESSLIVGESDQGMKSLYVALTRATRRLILIGSTPLPPVLADALKR